MRINRALNLVVPFDTAEGQVYIHSMPISREVFERYFLVISKTFAALISEGLSVISGPAAAFLMLKKIAQDMREWDGPAGVERGLIAEIHRLTNIVAPNPRGGWHTIPFQEALSTGVIEGDDVSEVEGLLCFFTCISTVPRREQRQEILDSMGSLWGARTESLSCTEFAASLPTSIETELSGETVPMSSVPS